MKRIILDLCGGTGAWSKPYQNNPDYDVKVLTLPDFNVEIIAGVITGKVHISTNDKDYERYYEIVKIIKSGSVYGILAAPPCTQFSIARNDKTAKKPRDLRQGMETINACFTIIHECLYNKYRQGQGLQFWALENPASGYLKKFLGKPALEFEPYFYGDPYTKKTALWGMFNEPKRKDVKPTMGTMVKYASDFKELKPVDPTYQKKLGIDSRTIRRSITPEGFANAFFNQNK